MKSVGETMAIGRTFKESFQKALRGLEVGSFGFGCDGKDLWGTDRAARRATRFAPSSPRPTPSGVWYLRYAFKSGMTRRRDPRADAASTPGSSTICCEIVETGGRAARRSAACDAVERRRCCARPSSTAFPIGSWPRSWSTHRDGRARRPQARAASWPRSSRSTPAPPSSRPTRRTTTRPTKTKTKRRPSRRARSGS